MVWYHADIQKVARSEWLGFITELEMFFTGTTAYLAKESARRIIEETTGVNNPRVIWNEC